MWTKRQMTVYDFDVFCRLERLSSFRPPVIIVRVSNTELILFIFHLCAQVHTFTLLTVSVDISYELTQIFVT